MAALIFGILIAAAAAFCMNYGIFLSWREVGQPPVLGVHGTWRTIKAFATSRPWLKAQGLTLLAGLLHGVAIGLASLSIDEPIGAAGICFLAVLTAVYLGEKAGWSDWLGRLLRRADRKTGESRGAMGRWIAGHNIPREVACPC